MITKNGSRFCALSGTFFYRWGLLLFVFVLSSNSYAGGGAGCCGGGGSISGVPLDLSQDHLPGITQIDLAADPLTRGSYAQMIGILKDVDSKIAGLVPLMLERYKAMNWYKTALELTPTYAYSCQTVKRPGYEQTANQSGHDVRLNEANFLKDQAKGYGGVMLLHELIEQYFPRDADENELCPSDRIWELTAVLSRSRSMSSAQLKSEIDDIFNKYRVPDGMLVVTRDEQNQFEKEFKRDMDSICNDLNAQPKPIDYNSSAFKNIRVRAGAIEVKYRNKEESFRNIEQQDVLNLEVWLGSVVYGPNERDIEACNSNSLSNFDGRPAHFDAITPNVAETQRSAHISNRTPRNGVRIGTSPQSKVITQTGAAE
jgi:hypothetical protein